MEKIVRDSIDLRKFKEYLRKEEKSPVTIEKYIRDVSIFINFIGEQKITKELTVAYKENLLDLGYAIKSINSMLASLNCLLRFIGCTEARVKSLKQQKQIYTPVEKELTKEEYMRLLDASKEQEQLNLVIQTICGTGIRISELKYFTVEAVKTAEVNVLCKGKSRPILVPKKLCKLLLKYASDRGIKEGSIFVTRSGKNLDRSNIWTQMKKLCEKAKVNPKKVFPHNLRKLFARTFYGIEKDIAKLADILGHSNIETTRIYIMTTGTEHREKIEQLGLVV